jgi:hypothetical protein
MTRMDRINELEAAALRIQRNPDNIIGGLKAFNSGYETHLKPAAQRKLDKINSEMSVLLNEAMEAILEQEQTTRPMPITYTTGRTYDSPQVLEIEIETRKEDEFGLEEITATFRDQSRHISGRVTALVFPDGIGPAVLTEYDAGRYEAI